MKPVQKRKSSAGIVPVALWFLVALLGSATLAVAASAISKNGTPGHNDMLAAADPVNGHALTVGSCTNCHSFDKGGPDGVGPNLFGIVGAHHAREKGYAYSPIMVRTANQVWTENALDKWLGAPASYLRGNKMAFPGISDPQDRADVIAYLKSLK